MNKPRGRSSRVVQATSEDGVIEDWSGQNTVEDAIWNKIHRKRFYTAEQVPICNGIIRGELGYMANMPAAREVLKGEYEYPLDIDQGTK